MVHYNALPKHVWMWTRFGLLLREMTCAWLAICIFTYGCFQNYLQKKKQKTQLWMTNSVLVSLIWMSFHGVTACIGRGQWKWEELQLCLTSRWRDTGRCGISLWPLQVKMNLKIMFFLHLNISPFPSYFLQSHSSHSSEVDENWTQSCPFALFLQSKYKQPKLVTASSPNWNLAQTLFRDNPPSVTAGLELRAGKKQSCQTLTCLF